MRRGKYEQHREPVVNVAMCLAIVLFWLVIITTYMSSGLFAKYSTMGSGKDSARVITFGELTVTETLDTGVTATGGNLIFVPGTTMKKDISVAFEGSEADTIVFVALDADGWTFTAPNATDPATFTLKQDATTLMSWKVASGWNYLASEGNQHVFYIFLDSNTPLGTIVDGQLVGKDFIAKNGEITVNVATYDAYDALAGADLNLNVTGYAVQANGFYAPDRDTVEDVATAAWNSVKSK